MSRIEHIGNATLYLGDCLEILPMLDKVDAVVTDPPYMNLMGNVSITFDSGVAKRKIDTPTVGDLWQANLEWVLPAWELAERAFFSWCSFHFLAELRVAIPKKPTCLITWFKRNSPPSVANAPQFKTEFCWVFRKGQGLNWRKLPTYLDIPSLAAGCFASERIVNSDGSAVHPTQKPITIIVPLIKIGLESVLDPFMGSGTTGVACINLRRKFIGIEIEEKYFDIACKRIDLAQRQGQLFEPAETRIH